MPVISIKFIFKLSEAANTVHLALELTKEGLASIAKVPITGNSELIGYKGVVKGFDE